jgi:hypothetical protein
VGCVFASTATATIGFVPMRSAEDATRAIEKLDGIELHGRHIRDDSATKPTPQLLEYRGETGRLLGWWRGRPRPWRPRRMGRRPRGDRYGDDRRGGYRRPAPYPACHAGRCAVSAAQGPRDVDGAYVPLAERAAARATVLPSWHSCGRASARGGVAALVDGMAQPLF